uniref:Uncharacterized protein n=1 Tax=Pundamilia nyererei TaxID=303518 RepID=A0A3B4H7T4_9CICH
MTLLHSVLALVLSWTGLCSVLYIFSTGLVAVVALWTARLLLRYTWYSHRLSCFSKPQTRSWLGWMTWCRHTNTPAAGSSVLSTIWSDSFTLTTQSEAKLLVFAYIVHHLLPSASITVKDELISHRLRPWLGE